ncbi:MAG: NAD(+) synthase, partial [Ileibacterium sp.]|nr:NAD(+) synthase [Ileibacterium sp.]
MNRYSYYKTAALTPAVAIGHPMENAKTILSLLHQLDKDVQLAVCPELCISGYTCQDLFYESLLRKQSLQALE